MADGIAKIQPAEAVSKAESMRQIANNIEMLLNEVDKRMQEINDESVGMYHGQYRPSELRSQLDSYRAQFNRFHEQIDSFANNVVNIAQQMLAE